MRTISQPDLDALLKQFLDPRVGVLYLYLSALFGLSTELLDYADRGTFMCFVDIEHNNAMHCVNTSVAVDIVSHIVLRDSRHPQEFSERIVQILQAKWVERVCVEGKL